MSNPFDTASLINSATPSVGKLPVIVPTYPFTGFLVMLANCFANETPFASLPEKQESNLIFL